MMKRRVVITGLGAVSPLASTFASSWKNLINSKSGIKAISSFDVSDLPSKIAGIIPIDFETNNDAFNANKFVPESDLKKMDKFILYAIAASAEALDDASWHPSSEEESERTGVVIGSGVGGLPRIYDTSVGIYSDGARRGVSPFFIPSCLINLASGHVSINHRLYGPNHSIATACASGSHAIGDGMRLIQFGDADVMVCGGAESAVFRLGVAGFAAARALSTGFNDNPQSASRPWDSGRDGFVIAEGSGILVLEELSHAKKRGAKIYAEIVGYGLSGDGFHITSPEPSGAGAFRAMRAAIKNAEIPKESIDYINAHGTSTVVGDLAEIIAVKKLFNEHAKSSSFSISSTKSATGHLLGGAGALEAVFCALAIRDGIMPPTLNLENPIDSEIDFVPHKAKEKKLKYVMSNSFGFGGTNASLIFKAFSD